MTSSFSGDVNEFFTGANTAPTPSIAAGPPPPAEPARWTAPQVHATGQFSVHRGELTTAADVVKKNLPRFSYTVSALQGLYGTFDFLSFWGTGETMCRNLTDIADAFVTVSQQTVQGHEDTAAKMTATSAAYEAAETSVTHAVKNPPPVSLNAGNLGSLLTGAAPGASSPGDITTMLNGGIPVSTPAPNQVTPASVVTGTAPSSSGPSSVTTMLNGGIPVNGGNKQ